MEQRTSPRDIFLHLLAILALYASAAGFLVLIFQYVNVLIPDLLDPRGEYALTSAYRTIRFSIASLIIVFPVYLATSWFLNKGYAGEPSKRNIGIRKWLTYFTLFAAAIIIIGDLVTLVFNLLGGDLTARFLLKVLAVFFVAGSVFAYYFWDLRRHKIE